MLRRVGCLINCRRIIHRRTIWTVIICVATTIMIPAAACASTAACNVSGEQPSEGGADPGVNRNIRCFSRVALAAADRIRRQKPFHALNVSGWCAKVFGPSILRQAIHFAPGAIPIWLPMPSSPIAVPVVWLPWPSSSQGKGESLPQGLLRCHG